MPRISEELRYTKNEGRSQPKEGCTRPQYVQMYSSEDLADVFEDCDGF